MIRKGDIVRFKREWRDRGDEGVLFLAMENEDGGRVKVQAQLGLAINPVQVVSVNMIERQEAAAVRRGLGKT